MLASVSWEDWLRIVAVGKAASPDSGRIILTGISIETDGHVVATDSYILALNKVTYISEDGFDDQVLLSAKGLEVALRTFRAVARADGWDIDKDKPEVTITAKAQRGMVSVAHLGRPLAEVYVRSIDGNFPKWEHLVKMPTKASTESKVGLNPDYLVRIVQTTPARTGVRYPVMVEMYGTDKPIRFRSPNDPEWLALQMPVRL